jgi:hypothetical protein
MYKHTTATPDWLYQQPNLSVDTLPTIKKELEKLFVRSKKFSLVPYTSTYMEISNTKLVTLYCPTLYKELQKLKLQESLHTIAFISVIADKHFPAHVDAEYNVALNIPLINCEKTYTVWYDGLPVSKENFEDYMVGAKAARTAVEGIADSLVEIGRCESNVPLWINVNAFHRPETHHNEFRVAASLRFDPEPLDEYGQLWPHLVKPK